MSNHATLRDELARVFETTNPGLAKTLRDACMGFVPRETIGTDIGTILLAWSAILNVEAREECEHQGGKE